MLRFTRRALDGVSATDDRFPKEFFIEAFFESHPVGNDYRLPPAWKHINERARRVRAAAQAAKEKAERKARRKEAKAARKVCCLRYF